MENLKKLHTVTILGVNLIPIIGVLIFDWSIFNIFFYFLIETIIVSVFYILNGIVTGTKKNIPFLLGLCLILFFLLSVFLLFIFTFFGPKSFTLFSLFSTLKTNIVTTKWYIAYLIASNVFSYGYYYLYYTPPRPDFTQSILETPYGKIIILYVSLFCGGILLAQVNILFTNNPAVQLHSNLIPLILFSIANFYTAYVSMKKISISSTARLMH